MKDSKIFISYAWGGESEDVVDKLYPLLKEKGFNVIRDKIDLGYKGNIREFMQQIGEGQAIIVVISDKYLKSENCMFEMLEIDNNKDTWNRIFPIVLPDAKIYKETDRIDYINYWQNEVKTLNDKAKTIENMAYIDNVVKKVNQYNNIQVIIDKITSMLQEMNTLTPAMHEQSGFNEMIKALDKSLAGTNENKSKSGTKKPFKTNFNAELYLFIDRSLQTQHFEEKLGDVGIHQPYIFITHGFIDDKMSSLVERFIYYTESEYEKSSQPFKFDFPLGSEHPDKALIKKICSDKIIKSLNIKHKQITTAASFLLHPEFNKQIIIYQIDFDARYWNKKSIEYIDWLINKFWAFDIIGREELPCLVFINIMYSSAKTTFMDKIKGKFTDDAIEKLLRKSAEAKENVCLFERLPEIQYEDYETLRNQNPELDLPKLMEQGQCLKMSEIEDKLKQVLKEKEKNVL